MFEVNLGLSYAIVAFISMVQLLVIWNRTKATAYKETIDYDYCRTTLFFAGFCFVDGLWGFCDAGLFLVTKPLFWMAIYGYHIMTALSAFFWFEYMMEYMRVGSTGRKVLNTVRTILVLGQMGLIASNMFTQRAFYIDENLTYRSGDLRSVLYWLQFSYYIFIWGYALIAVKVVPDKKKRYLQASLFSIVPFIFGIAQWLLWELPMYSLGFAFTAMLIYVINVSDAREKFALQRAQILDESANTDVLTGLLNRRAYELELKKYEGKPFPADFLYISMDVNRLKYVNDNLGHEAGDELIVGVANCIAKTFGRYGKVFRTGGDEFVALIVVREGEQVGLFNSFTSMVMSWKGEIVDSMSVSVGAVSHRECPNEDVLELSRIADKRMYADKANFYRKSGIDRRNR